jgi:hypothetical protein
MNVMNTFGIEHAMPGENMYFDADYNRDLCSSKYMSQGSQESRRIDLKRYFDVLSVNIDSNREAACMSEA